MDSSTSKCTSTNTELGYWQDLDYSDKVEHLFTTGHAADCKFIVGAEYETAEVIHGHKFMFRLVSPVFERMFDSHFVETHHSTEIRLRDVEPQDFKNFRFMIYNNSEANLSQLSFADIVKVYKLCDQYMIKSISENCMTHIWKLLEAMDIDNLIIIFGFACYLEDVRLLEAVKEKIKLSKEKIAVTVNDLNEHSFYDYIIYLNVLEVNAVPLLNVINSYFVSNNLLPIEELEDEEIILKVEEKVEEKEKEPLVKVVSDDNSPPDENVVPEPAPVDLKVVEPINDDEVLRPKTKNSLLNNLFQLINFTTLTPAEFADGPGKLQILSVKKKYEILSFLCTKNK